MEPSIMPVTGNAKLDHWFALAFMVTNTASILASALNAKVRAAFDAVKDDGAADVPKAFLYLALVLNYAAFNIDKAAQLHRILRGADVTVLKLTNEEKKS
jgi:hypothetical protein